MDSRGAGMSGQGLRKIMPEKYHVRRLFGHARTISRAEMDAIFHAASPTVY